MVEMVGPGRTFSAGQPPASRRCVVPIGRACGQAGRSRADHLARFPRTASGRFAVGRHRCRAVLPVTQWADTSARVTTATATVVTGDRDSWWSLAERHLGEGLRWRELRALNLERTVSERTTIGPDTDQLESGWSLLVPASDDRTTPPAEPAGQETAEPAPDPSPLWEVQGGDHFWRIATVTL